MFESIDDYSLRKLIDTIIFDFETKDYSSLPHLFNLRVIESLKNMVKFYSEQNLLSYDVTNNVSNFLIQARRCEDKDRYTRIDLINEIIVAMNAQTQDESHILYRVQLFYRRCDKRYLYSADKEEIEMEEENVHDSICNDLEVLYTHSDDITEEEFTNEHLPVLVENSDLYFESLNMFLYENPTVFKNKIFYDRMTVVLNNIKKTYNDDKQEMKEYNKLVKKINKEVKKKYNK